MNKLSFSIITLILFLHLGPILFKIESWPLTYYPMYIHKDQLPGQGTLVYRTHLIYKNGKKEELSPFYSPPRKIIFELKNGNALKAENLFRSYLKYFSFITDPNLKSVMLVEKKLSRDHRQGPSCISQQMTTLLDLKVEQL